MATAARIISDYSKARHALPVQYIQELRTEGRCAFLIIVTTANRCKETALVQIADLMKLQREMAEDVGSAYATYTRSFSEMARVGNARNIPSQHVIKSHASPYLAMLTKG